MANKKDKYSGYFKAHPYCIIEVVSKCDMPRWRKVKRFHKTTTSWNAYFGLETVDHLRSCSRITESEAFKSLGNLIEI